MNIFDLVERLRKCTDEKEAYVINSMIEEYAKTQKEELKPLLEDGDLGSTLFADLGKSLDLIEMQKATLDVDKIKECLSDEEIRSAFKPTEKAIKDLKRKDLLTDEFKTVNIVKQLRVVTLKESVVA